MSVCKRDECVPREREQCVRRESCCSSVAALLQLSCVCNEREISVCDDRQVTVTDK